MPGPDSSFAADLIVPEGLICGYSGKRIVSTPAPIILPSGGISVLVGNNGAGKSTFLKTLSGALTPIGGSAPETSAIYLPEDLDFPSGLTVEAIIDCFFPLLTAADEIALLWGLPLQSGFGDLSKGNRQKLRVLLAELTASVGGANLLCLDEPLSGIDETTAAIFIAGWGGGRAMPHFEGHRIISVHRGQVPPSFQMLVVAGGKVRSVPPAATCDGWMLHAIESGIHPSDFVA